jgi:ADP-ribose pyrophosphatase YjhB (NUDIX family)
MINKPAPLWLKWAREIQTLAQTGLAFSEKEYDKQRYTKLNEIAAEILEKYTQLDSRILKKIFMEQPGYATPKVDVRSAVIEDNKILLVQEKMDEKWAMPGGWADVGDYPSEVAIRETKEESGFDVKPTKVVGVFDANRAGGQLQFFHAFKIIFLCDLLGGEARTSDETLKVDFFYFDDLPPLSENRTNHRFLNEIQNHLTDPARAAWFD